jgi:DNA repair exonuclease SbcCD ATPase subunit
MKIVKFSAKNFGSYEKLEFSFEEGLTLISGATGSGKSTFQDIAFWGLYGVTAKGGSVDDVRSWSSPDLATEVEVSLETPLGAIEVFRIRGKNYENDLYWIEEGQEVENRGKDIKETQKLLEVRMGVSSNTYETAAYFHEFSPTVGFFIASSKAQRALLEEIANLKWPATLAAKITELRKITKSEIIETEKLYEKQKGKLEQLTYFHESTISAVSKWDKELQNTLASLSQKQSNFVINKSLEIEKQQKLLSSWQDNNIKQILEIKNKITALPKPTSAICKECQQPIKSAAIAEKQLLVYQYELKSLIQQINPYINSLAKAEQLHNHYDEQIKEESKKINPFLTQIDTILSDIDKAKKYIDVINNKRKEQKANICRLDTIYDLSFELRGQLLHNAIKLITEETNRCLETYFDSEIQICLEIEGADGISIIINKNGHICNFKQLSKGQRGLLTLCFTVAMMKASANRAGVHFEQLFFDEALSGFDADLKVKAFRLFQELNINHSSIYLIDHSTEFKSLFDKQYKVEIISDISIIVLDE